MIFYCFNFIERSYLLVFDAHQGTVMGPAKGRMESFGRFTTLWVANLGRAICISKLELAEITQVSCGKSFLVSFGQPRGQLFNQSLAIFSPGLSLLFFIYDLTPIIQ